MAKQKNHKVVCTRQYLQLMWFYTLYYFVIHPRRENWQIVLRITLKVEYLVYRKNKSVYMILLIYCLSHFYFGLTISVQK